MKRIFAILLVLALTAFLLSACKKDEDREEPVDPPVSENGGESEGEEESEGESESGEIEYATKNVIPVSPEKGSADLPEVPLLPNGELPGAE